MTVTSYGAEWDCFECDCFFCINGKEHPERHATFVRITSLLLVAESLDPKDSIPLEGCVLCGHTRVVGS